VRPVVLTGICFMTAAWLAMGFGIWSIVAIVVGAMLLDIGLRAAMVANQTLINSALPDSRGRANTLFGLHVWSGNAVGAYLASLAFAQLGWLAVCALAVIAMALAFLVHVRVLPVGNVD
jgi:predicted MFS family arabinose efflux permease